MNNVFFNAVRRESVKWVATAAIGLAASLCLSATAQAKDSHKPKNDTRSVYLVKYRVNNEVRYNKNPMGKVVKVSASQYFGATPYVCTPSGFGQKSRCFMRD
ncbi:hypothetical protein [Brucella haematophila]|uniref:hypothetical protein n=1 Tax=Brucella haematophila TaxID=419474 RepID=UPI00110EFADA|nr:hypothetical protein [Brucella haematophila]TMV03558.1 hypothetical protein FGI60_10315 [Brucella haematophila]